MTHSAPTERVRVSVHELDEDIDRLPFSEHERAALFLLVHHTREVASRTAEIILG